MMSRYLFDVFQYNAIIACMHPVLELSTIIGSIVLMPAGSLLKLVVSKLLMGAYFCMLSGRVHTGKE